MNNNNDVNTTNTNKGGGGENKNWSNAYEKFRKEASDLTEEEAKELWRKTKQCMAIQQRYAPLCVMVLAVEIGAFTPGATHDISL